MPSELGDLTCLEPIRPRVRGTYEVRARHTAAAVSAPFDTTESGVVRWSGPVLRLAERAGLPAVAGRWVRGCRAVGFDNSRHNTLRASFITIKIEGCLYSRRLSQLGWWDAAGS